MKTTDGYDLVVPSKYYYIKDRKVKSKTIKYDSLVDTSNIYKYKSNADAKISKSLLDGWFEVIKNV